jgi:YD repeat-containing protein
VTISNSGGNVLIHELLIVEDGAITNTYTYDVLKGRTSHSDTNGSMITTTYDELGRSITKRDETGAIIETNKYHIADSN